MRKTFITNEGTLEYTTEELYNKYKKLIHKYTNKYIKYENPDYEDLFQIACIAFIKAYNSYDISKNLSFTTYVVRVIEHEIVCKYIRYNKMTCRDKNVQADSIYANTKNGTKFDFTEIVSDKHNLENHVISKELVKEIFNSLDDRTRAIFIYRYIHDLSLKDISKLVGTPPQNVNKILWKGRNKIKNKYKDIL